MKKTNRKQMIDGFGLLLSREMSRSDWIHEYDVNAAITAAAAAVVDVIFLS